MILPSAAYCQACYANAINDKRVGEKKANAYDSPKEKYNAIITAALQNPRIYNARAKALDALETDGSFMFNGDARTEAFHVSRDCLTKCMFESPLIYKLFLKLDKERRAKQAKKSE